MLQRWPAVHGETNGHDRGAAVVGDERIGGFGLPGVQEVVVGDHPHHVTGPKRDDVVPQVLDDRLHGGIVDGGLRTAYEHYLGVGGGAGDVLVYELLGPLALRTVGELVGGR